MNVTNGSLCQNGAVLTGKALEEYSRRKGLCSICARVETHKRAGKIFKRNQWSPLTVLNQNTNGSGNHSKGDDYIVYKGYCIQPTCYTLNEAKRMLGEKPSIASRNRSRGRSTTTAVLKSAAVANAAIRALQKHDKTNTSELVEKRQPSITNTKATPPVTWRRESSIVGDDESDSDYVHSSTTNNINSRRGSQTSMNNSSFTERLMDSQRSTLMTNNAKSSSQRVMSGRLSPTGSISAANNNNQHTWSRDVPLISLPSLDDTEFTNENKGKEPTRSSEEVNSEPGSVNDNAPATTAGSAVVSTTTTQKPKKGGKMIGKLMTVLAGKRTRGKRVDSSTSSLASSTDSWSLTLSVQGHNNSKNGNSKLPGSGFVAKSSGGGSSTYRAALEALDLAGGDNTNLSSRALMQRASSNMNKHQSGDLQALCLQQPKHQFNYLDREAMLVVDDEVDSLHRQWLGEEFLLDTLIDNKPLNNSNVQEIFFDISGTPMVRLSHISSGDVEELELEANLDEFYDDLDDGSLVLDSNDTSSELLVFKTRASLENEIDTCEVAIEVAEQSDTPSAIQRGIEASGRLGVLMPLRKLHLTKHQLEKRINRLTQAMLDLDENKLDLRYELAMEKDQLTIQFNDEIGEEEKLQQMRELQEVGAGEGEQGLVVEDTAGFISISDSFSDSLEALPAWKIPSKENNISKVVVPSKKSAVSGLWNNLVGKPKDIHVRMTVFQSAPLAYVDPKSGTHHVCPLLDFEYEARALTQSLKDAATKRGRIEIDFDIATTDRMSAFLANSESRVMHLSCHGHPEYLALENGFGGMQILPVRDLKRFVAVGAGNLEVVFVSACHSKTAGKAFLDAGIKHVICCRQDDKFRDEGAIEFARSFYRALALNNTLKQAFKIAREATRVSPMVRDSKAEYEKFILLPELPDNDPYHDVHIFKSRNSPVDQDEPSETEESTGHSRILPRVSPFFVGRETDMYTILEALQSSDVVRIQGPPNVGKSTVVAAATRYIEERQKSFLFDDILWLPVQQEAIDAKDTLYLNFSRLMEVIGSAWGDELPQTDRAYGVHWGRLARQVQGKRILLVINGQCFTTGASRDGLDVFLRNLLKISNTNVITVGLPLTDEDGLDSAIVNIDALDFNATVLLFARMSISVSFSSQQIISALTAFPKLTSNQNSSQDCLVQWRRSKIYDCIGKGIPSAIRRAALDMSDTELDELMKVSKRPLLEIHSRSELDRKISDLEAAEGFQQQDKKFLIARDTHDMIEELESLRQSFPSLRELNDEETELKCALQAAINAKQYDNADRLQRRLISVQKQLSLEIEQREKARTTIESFPSF